METGPRSAPANPAVAYEGFFVPAMFAPLASVLVRRANPRPGERLLDIACGTGIVARTVAPIVGDGGRVVGLDLSPDMLAVARSVSASQGLPVEWHEGRAEALPFADGSFDLVLCQQGLQFVPDKAAALAEVRRVLVGGGRVALAVWQGLDRHPFWTDIDTAILKHLRSPALQAPFSLGDAETLRALLTDAGFEDVATEPVSITARFRDPGRFVTLQVSASAAAIPALQHLSPQAREELAAAVRADMEPTIGNHLVEDHLEVPMHALVARARRL